MATPVTFRFKDSRGRYISRTVVHTSDVLSDVISAANTLGGLWDPLTDLELEAIVMSVTDLSPAFSGAAVSNRDEAGTAQVRQENGYKYAFKLPDVPDAKFPSETMSLTDTDLIAFFDVFNPSTGVWRVNVQNPQAVSAIIKVTLDT